MKIPSLTRCDIKIVQVSIIGQAVLCDIYFNELLLYKGLQNFAYPIPFGTYRGLVYKGNHDYERILLQNVPHHTFVEIHEANHFTQLKGCTGIGYRLSGQVLNDSLKALISIVSKVKQYDVCYVTLSSSIKEPAYTV
jgi:hypothetical protein